MHMVYTLIAASLIIIIYLSEHRRAHICVTVYFVLLLVVEHVSVPIRNV